MADQSLQDDEASLARHAGALLGACEQVVGDWIRWSIASRAPQLALTPGADQAVERGSATIVAELRELLLADIAEQTESPLQVLRRGVSHATQFLLDAGVEPAPRDDFSRQAFPDDHFGLAPAAFVDVDQSLHEPGLVWGAAKAHVHLRRRREADA